MSAIPNFNKPDYIELIDSLKKGTCIFIGAGISKLAGYKLWKELSDEMVEAYWKARKIDYSTKCILSKNENCIENMDYLFFCDETFFREIITKIFKNVKEKMTMYEKIKILCNITKNNFIFKFRVFFPGNTHNEPG